MTVIYQRGRHDIDTHRFYDGLMLHRMSCLTFLAALTLSSAANAHNAKPWVFEDAAEALKNESCNRAESDTAFDPLDLSMKAVTLGQDAALPAGFHFAGGWELTSEDPNFGGLSGIAFDAEGQFLTVSDTGQFIRLMRTETGLTGGAEMAPMTFENPLIQPGKLTADAEGLDITDGLTFVSFERDFRVLAFALDQCGVAARGMFVANPPSRYGLRPIRANAGPEALWMDQDGHLRVLYEQLRDQSVTQAQITEDGKGHLSSLSPPPNLAEGFRPVGADQLLMTDNRVVQAFLYRAYDRETGNRIRLDILPAGQDSPITLGLAPPQLTDNFEGVTLEETSDGLRAWIISDDNFSDRQQTLLYAFDVILPGARP